MKFDGHGAQIRSCRHRRNPGNLFHLDLLLFLRFFRKVFYFFFMTEVVEVYVGSCLSRKLDPGRQLGWVAVGRLADSQDGVAAAAELDFAPNHVTLSEF